MRKMTAKFIDVNVVKHQDVTNVEGVEKGAVGIQVTQVRLAICDHMLVPPPRSVNDAGYGETLEQYFLRTHQIHLPKQFSILEQGDTYFEAWEKIAPQLVSRGIRDYKEFIDAPKDYPPESLAPLGWHDTQPAIGKEDYWKVWAVYEEAQCQNQTS